MTERLGQGERKLVKVACPINRFPANRPEALELQNVAVAECRKLIGPEAKILGVNPELEYDYHPFTNEELLIFEFLCDVPESAQLATRIK